MARMNATPLLAQVLGALHEHRLEAVLIGNAAAAIHGAPVTTLDFDFMFRDTPTNMRKLKAVATDLRATILRPFYPVSKLYRVVNEDTGLQADFMPVIHGVRSFEGLRSRADARDIDGLRLLVASLDDIIASKKAAGRDRDKAVLSILEQTRKSARKQGANGS
jgi:predicted nucleotidyltransferase